MQPLPVPISRTRARGWELQPGLEAVADQLREGRARDQHALVHVEGPAGEPGLVEQIGRGQALGDASRHQRPAAGGVRSTHRMGPGLRLGVRQAERVENQCRGVIAAVVGAVHADDLRGFEFGFALIEQRAERDIGSVHGRRGLAPRLCRMAA